MGKTSITRSRRGIRVWFLYFYTNYSHRDEVPDNKSVDDCYGYHYRPGSQVQQVLKWTTSLQKAFIWMEVLTIFLSWGTLDSRDCVKLVMWVSRKNPEMKNDVQKMKDSKPLPPMRGMGSRDRTPPAAPTITWATIVIPALLLMKSGFQVKPNIAILIN